MLGAVLALSMAGGPALAARGDAARGDAAKVARAANEATAIPPTRRTRANEAARQATRACDCAVFRPTTDGRSTGSGPMPSGLSSAVCCFRGRFLWVVWESIHRLYSPSEVSGGPVILIGLIGMAVNGGSALAIGRGHDHQLSVRAARLHLLGDFAGSAVVLVSGLLLQAFAWDRIDPIASLLVTALVARSMIGLLRQSTDVLLDAVPAGIAMLIVCAQISC